MHVESQSHRATHTGVGAAKMIARAKRWTPFLVDCVTTLVEVGFEAVMNMRVTVTLPLEACSDIHGNNDACAAVDMSVAGGQEKLKAVGQQVMALALVDARQASVYRGGHCDPTYVIAEFHSDGRHSVVCVGPPTTSLRSLLTP